VGPHIKEFLIILSKVHTAHDVVKLVHLWGNPLLLRLLLGLLVVPPTIVPRSDGLADHRAIGEDPGGGDHGLVGAVAVGLSLRSLLLSLGLEGSKEVLKVSLEILLQRSLGVILLERWLLTPVIPSVDLVRGYKVSWI